MLYAHGGLNSVKASANRIAAMRAVWLENGIYPIHFMYDTGLIEEIKDVVIGKHQRAERVTSGFSDWLDKRIEQLARRPGSAIWKEMKEGARLPFKNQSDGTDSLKRILKHIGAFH